MRTIIKKTNMRTKLILLTLLATLTISHCVRGQYRWHIVHPDRIGSLYYGFTSVSCKDGNCSAAVVAYPNDSSHITPNTNLIFHSSDDGLTWASVDSIPQWFYYSQGKSLLYLGTIEQMDSLDAIAIDQRVGVVLRTFDGWKTWQEDTQALSPDTIGGRIFYTGLYDLDFSNVAEGMVSQGYGFYLSTVDTGKHWKPVVSHNATFFHSYGSGMFRLFAAPDTIFTTRNNWDTIDTTVFMLSDTLRNPNVKLVNFVFSGADSITEVCVLLDSTQTHYSLLTTSSSDLGEHWEILPMPNDIKMDPNTVSSFEGQTIVIAGQDSVGRIVMSMNGGASWQADTVPLSDNAPYYFITSISITESGRVLAAIETDDNYIGSTVLAYLEPIPSRVTPTVSTQQNLTLYPNPATNVLNLVSLAGTISISDPLGRSYAVPTTPQPPPTSLRSAGGGVTVDISTLPSGVYFVSDGVNRAKFVKE